MLRTLMAAGAALLAAATLGLTAHVPAQASVSPTAGIYHGVDERGNKVSFTVTADHEVKHFSIAGRSFYLSGAHIRHGAFADTSCDPEDCATGEWTSATSVSGTFSWRGSPTHRWSATFHPDVHRTPGLYVAADHSGRVAVSFRLEEHEVGRFTIAHHRLGVVDGIRNGGFEACDGSYCVRGHWQTAHLVVGAYRAAYGGHWTPYDARWSAS